MQNVQWCARIVGICFGGFLGVQAADNEKLPMDGQATAGRPSLLASFFQRKTPSGRASGQASVVVANDAVFNACVSNLFGEFQHSLSLVVAGDKAYKSDIAQFEAGVTRCAHINKNGAPLRTFYVLRDRRSEVFDGIASHALHSGDIAGAQAVLKKQAEEDARVLMRHAVESLVILGTGIGIGYLAKK